MNILLVEDDQSIADSVVDGLGFAGIKCSHVGTGKAALIEIAKNNFDLILLDLGLPDMDGQEVAKEVRNKMQTPIIILSARDSEVDRVLALELGADDYVVKPFGMRELVARIKAVIRRTGSSETAVSGEIQKIGSLSLDRRSQKVFLKTEEISLTAKEFELLSYLAKDPGAVYKRNDILTEVWDVNWYGSTKTLDAHVAAIRKKLGNPDWIESVRGVGFRMGTPN